MSLSVFKVKQDQDKVREDKHLGGKSQDLSGLGGVTGTGGPRL